MLTSEERNRELRRWGVVLILLFLLGVLLLTVLLRYQPASASPRRPVAIPVSIRSGLAADYGSGGLFTRLPAFQMQAISDAIRDQEKDEAGAPSRMRAVAGALKTPVPTVTPFSSSTPTAVASSTSVWVATTASTLEVSGTAAPTGTPTPTSQIAASPSPTPFTQNTLPASPTTTLTETATSTSNSTSGPSATPQASKTPTELVSHPSATPTATSTPTPTTAFTPTPTKTLCLPPDPRKGFVDSISPADGSQGISVFTDVVIHFSQALEEKTIQGSVDLKGKNAKYDLHYDPETYTLVLNPTKMLWFDSQYEVRVKGSLTNLCGVEQDVDVETTFQTEKFLGGIFGQE